MMFLTFLTEMGVSCTGLRQKEKAEIIVLAARESGKRKWTVVKPNRSIQTRAEKTADKGTDRCLTPTRSRPACWRR